MIQTIKDLVSAKADTAVALAKELSLIHISEPTRRS